MSDPTIPTPSQNAIITANEMSGIGRLYNRPTKGMPAPEESPAMGTKVGDGVRVHSSYSPKWVADQQVCAWLWFHTRERAA